MGVAHNERWTLNKWKIHLTTYVLSEMPWLADCLKGSGHSATSYVWQPEHEDMLGEAFAYTRQTLADQTPKIAPPSGGLVSLDSGPLNGEVFVPGGEHTLGADETVGFRFDNEKPADTRSL